MLKTLYVFAFVLSLAYHLGEGRVLKTYLGIAYPLSRAYHLGEGRVLKTKLSNNKGPL